MNKKVPTDKTAFNIPKDIHELAQRLYKKRLKKEKSEKLIKQKREAKQKNLRIARLKNGLEYATKIFLWATELRESDDGKELMKASHGSDLCFFNGQVMGTEKVSLGISVSGLFWRYSGLRCSNQRVYSAENLAESVETIILQEVCKWIDNGDVWYYIKHRF
ncbi:MAG: hypothetical protein G01um101413_87 [Parcubacteria group bacterium Gr01-1014_13]|nr:MAG: hypothetical protein G01um101413_87 [Parcubacteria group bacterium Gr01-1014_13]